MSDLDPIFEGLIKQFAPLSVDETNAAIRKAAPDLYWALYELVKKCPFQPTRTGITAEITFAQIKKAQAALKLCEQRSHE